MRGEVKRGFGSAQRGAGDLLGDSRLQADGATSEAEGTVENLVGQAKDAVRQAADSASEYAQEAYDRGARYVRQEWNRQATHPGLLAPVLQIVHRVIAPFLINKPDSNAPKPTPGAVTLMRALARPLRANRPKLPASNPATKRGVLHNHFPTLLLYRCDQARN